MNGNSSTFSTPAPFTLSMSKGKRGVFQKPVKEFALSSPRPSERFRALLGNLGLSNPLFGLIRPSVLRKTNLLGSYLPSDVALLSELALQGTFYEVPEYLFLRRDHPEKADRANPTLDQMAVVYDPRNKGKISLLNWKLFYEHLLSIKRVHIDWFDKVACYAYMGKWLWWRWREMGKELTVALK